MTGLEILAALMGCFVVGAGALAMTVVVSERRKRLFIESASLSLEAHIDHVESGDITVPLSFNVGAVRVHAALRGDVEVWQLESVVDVVTRTNDANATTFAVVYAGWRAPDARDLQQVGDVTPRLALYAGDEKSGSSLLSRAKAQLASVLGRRTRRCHVREGRAFLELTRRGLAVDELRDAILRFDALLAVVGGRDALSILPPSLKDAAVAGPSGVPVPALTG